ncbi:tyrosine-protein phosphatase [Levilactobacillus tongjiangensis]|uniref:Tyrosine-protein phosphatase n=1 Tax=Levilactobacillus tongjiangensis TaxID=2486023 RepID=A0ABW1SRQ7_9LACO|nr:tyrosine-protein phosphatase [Levilactobacillus tongjiangensis]
MTHRLQRTLSISMLTLTLMGMGTPVVTSLAATTPTTQVPKTPDKADPDRVPILNGEQMPETMATPKVPAAGKPGSRIALSKDSKGFNANTRDLGGYLTKDKTQAIKSGLLFRSAQLTRVTNSDINKLAGFSISLIIDLRTPFNHMKKKDALIGKATSKVAAIYSQSDDDDLSGVQHYNRANGGSIAFSPTALSGYHDFLTDLVNAQGPILYHCKHGNDRTGIATVLLMSILGMRNQDIINDYLMSNNYVDKQVEYTWLKTYIGQIDEKFGSLNNYITSPKGLNFSADQQAALRAKYLVPSGLAVPKPMPVSTPKPIEKPTPAPTPKPLEKPTPAPTVPTSNNPVTSPAPIHAGQPDLVVAKPHQAGKTKMKVLSVKKLKHAKAVHLKAHRAYFFDLHLKHKVGKSGKTGRHPRAKWQLIKQAKLRINGKIKTYVEVQSPHGKKRWIQLKDVSLIKNTANHSH